MACGLGASGVRFGIIGEKQLTNEMPEYRIFPVSVNTRARGMGAGSDTMLSATAKENVLDVTNDCANAVVVARRGA